MAETKPTVDEHGRPEGENVARMPEPKVLATPLTMEDVHKRVAEGKAKIASQPPPPLRPGDWGAALQAITNLTARIKVLEGKSEPEKPKK